MRLGSLLQTKIPAQGNPRRVHRSQEGSSPNTLLAYSLSLKTEETALQKRHAEINEDHGFSEELYCSQSDLEMQVH